MCLPGWNIAVFKYQADGHHCPSPLFESKGTAQANGSAEAAG